VTLTQDYVSQNDALRSAERARTQASDVPGDLYARGAQIAGAVRDSVEEQPWIALAVVALFGVMIGCALRRG
jgi:ElaB/YqjD/DUF883 family membrane-anchored ribosome-binding protein